MNLRLSIFALAVGCAADITAPPKPAPFITGVYDPAASPAPQIPLPNDLAKLGGDGVHLNVPDLPTDSAAQKDFNHYLNTLDGFPPVTPVTFSFSGTVDPAKVTGGSPTMPGSVLVFENGSCSLPLSPDSYTLTVVQNPSPSPSPKPASVTLAPKRRWSSGSQFTVLVFGGTDANGVKALDGSQVLAAPAFFFLRSPKPLIGKCGDGTAPDCVCPDPTDKTCHSVVVGLPDAQARQLEPLRRGVSASLDTLVPCSGTDGDMPRSRDNVVLSWSFSIASAPMAVFDPDRGDVPFPNDALINQMTGKVNLPIDPADPQAATKMGLNLLDGFSTTAPETLMIDSAADIDPATVVAGRSAVMLGVTSNNMPEYSAGPVLVNGGTSFAGQIQIQPISALESDQIRYAVIVSGAVKDKQGRALVAPPTIVLSRGKNPLVDANGHSTVSVLSDAQAQQLEVLRKALAPLYDLAGNLLMLPREQIAAAWTFTTESIHRPLNALNELPQKSGFSTDVTISHIANSAEITAKAAMLSFPSANLRAIVLGTFTTKRAADPASGLITFANNTGDSGGRFSVVLPAMPVTDTVRFVLNLPQTAGPWPVAIVVHGLGDWRGHVMPVADAFAAAGWATIMFDQTFHGARSACTDGTQCVGGTCTDGMCAGGFKFATPSQMDPYACALQPISGDATDCNPLASGAAFVNPGDLFGSRDNLRQFTVDAAQLVRVLGDTGNANGLFQQLTTAGLAYDPASLGLLGHSLGGIVSTLYLSVAPKPTTAALNVDGGHLFDIIASGTYSSLLLPLLTSLMVQPDTAEYFQLANTAKWILDPADPIAVGQHLVRDPVVSYTTGSFNGKKNIIIQESGMDATILPPFQAALAREINGPGGIDADGHAQGHTTGGAAVSTYFPTAVHGSLLYPLPSAAVMQSIQAQAVGFISSSGASLPSP
jgi:pimeloyl-ACP methyl ester carboxylesterase